MDSLSRTAETKRNTTMLPRSEKHCHIIVTEKMHHALKLYAAKHHLSVFNATSRLLQLGITAELSGEHINKNPKIAETNELIHELAKQSLD
jgi:hypothetical protein